ncbi:DUF1634 domain-containing protein [Candidatus Falkowbacteria bacterium]|nr:DUF1634 domain-containing protein [Candidatus Falkowbacteria bacterium]
MFFKSIKITIAATLLFFLFLPGLSLAQEGLKPDIQVSIPGTNLKADLQAVNCDPGSKEPCSIGWIGQYVGALYRFGVAIAAALSVIMIMAGGFLWLTSGGSPDRVNKAKDFITSALAGLMLALFSFIILYTVNPRLVTLEPSQIRSPMVGSGDQIYYSDDGTVEIESTMTRDRLEQMRAENEAARIEVARLEDNYGAQLTSFVRDDNTRHDPDQPGYVGNVMDFHYEPDDTFHQYIVNNAERVERISWGTAYTMPDGSVAVLEPGGQYGYHWHYEFNVPGWTWRPNR